jgi:hypothetical protein
MSFWRGIDVGRSSGVGRIVALGAAVSIAATVGGGVAATATEAGAPGELADA